MIDPEELDELARQLEAELAEDPEREFPVAPCTAPEVAARIQDRKDAHSRMRMKVVDVIDGLREAASECRKSHGL